MKEYSIRTEYALFDGKYADIFIEGNKTYMNQNIMIELKYIKESVKDKETAIEKQLFKGFRQLSNYEVEQNNVLKYLIIFVGRKVVALKEVKTLQIS